MVDQIRCLKPPGFRAERETTVRAVARETCAVSSSQVKLSAAAQEETVAKNLDENSYGEPQLMVTQVANWNSEG